MMVGRHVRVRLKELGPVRAFIYTFLLIILAIAVIMGVALAVLLYLIYS